jgi:hypothetical protein
MTASEVLHTLRFMAMKGVKRTYKFDVLRALLFRFGNIKMCFLVKLMLRNAVFGLGYQGGLIARVLARA